MSFQYSQSTGTITHNGEPFGTGYSGHGQGLNNSDMQNVRGVGPLPQGFYTIQPPTVHPKLGPVAMELLPYSTNTMFLRDGFFIHGDTAAMNHTASDGCIVLNHDVRVSIAESVLAGDNKLEVTA